ncbi:MAG: hypothetical protein SGJ09_01675 [Phycisphaerae bacterium]|nr:hypothetical protein [Phycisphaerae bacterium]
MNKLGSQDCDIPAGARSGAGRSSLVRRPFAILAAATLLLTSVALAETRLSFKSGQSWRGEIADTVSVVYVEGGKELTLEGKLLRADKTMVVVEGIMLGKIAKKTIFFGDVKSMTTTTSSAPAPVASTSGGTSTTTPPPGGTSGGTTTAAPSGAAQSAEHKTLPANYQGVLFLPIEGMVGTGTREDEIKKIGQEADRLGPGQIIVIEITSPGGMVIEADQIHPTIMDIRKRHRVIAWIKEAISAAAFTALHCDEIYFMKEGAMGSMTMFAGTTAIQGAELDAWLKLAGEVAAESGRDPQIARCMIKKSFALSYDIPEGGGPKDAVFRPDTKGKVVLDTPDTMLTINSSQALACGISDGTADTPEELAKLLNLPEWKEVNDVGRRLHKDWHRTLDTGMEEIPKLVFRLGRTGGIDRVGQIGADIQTCEKLLAWWAKCTECMIELSQKGIGVPPEESLKERLIQLRDELAAIKKQERDNKAGN